MRSQNPCDLQSHFPPLFQGLRAAGKPRIHGRSFHGLTKSTYIGIGGEWLILCHLITHLKRVEPNGNFGIFVGEGDIPNKCPLYKVYLYMALIIEGYHPKGNTIFPMINKLNMPGFCFLPSQHPLTNLVFVWFVESSWDFTSFHCIPFPSFLQGNSPSDKTYGQIDIITHGKITKIRSQTYSRNPSSNAYFPRLSLCHYVYIMVSSRFCYTVRGWLQDYPGVIFHDIPSLYAMAMQISHVAANTTNFPAQVAHINMIQWFRLRYL